MKIETVSIDDANELLEIYSYYVKETAVSFEYDVPSVDDFRKRIKKILEKYPYIKAVRNDGYIMGYAYANTFKSRAAYDWSVETTVYVRNNLRQTGVGKALYQELEGYLRNMGVLNMNACIAVTSQEDIHLTNASVHFHEKMGFKLVGTFHNSGYKFNTWYDMIWMEKMIGEHKAMQAPVLFGEK
ncbi:MAG: N-acetyltransferase family protein [Butyribacter sp.]|nr:N-acetyltransferase family protein [Butyribacter sp.]